MSYAATGSRFGAARPNLSDPNDPRNYSNPQSPYYGMPTAPNYAPGYNPDTMSFAPEIERRLSKINVNQEGLGRFRDLATRKGSSPWAVLQLQKAQDDELAAKEEGIQGARGAAATAESRLAMTGGLSSGARERLARGGVRDLIGATQAASREGGRNRLAIGIADEENRISQLGQLPGMESQAYRDSLAKEQMFDSARQNDINRAIEENNRRMQFNLNRYQQQTQAWGAQQQAQATKEAGKK